LGISGQYSVPTFTYMDNVGTTVISSGRLVDVVKSVNDRSQLTTQAIYISPVIRTMPLIGDVFIGPMYDRDVVSTRIKNNIYSWLDLNADFNTEIPLSNIIEIVENDPATISCNLSFSYGKPKYRSYKTNRTDWSADIFRHYRSNFSQGVYHCGFSDYTQTVLDNTFGVALSTLGTYNGTNYYVAGNNGYITITENDFVNVWMPAFNKYLLEKVYGDDSVTSTDKDSISYDIYGFTSGEGMPPITIYTMDKYQYSPLFLSYLSNIRRMLSPSIQRTLINGTNIANYSMRNEICRVDVSGLNFVYKA